MSVATPTTNPRLAFRAATFETLTEGLDYAAKGETGNMLVMAAITTEPWLSSN